MIIERYEGLALDVAGALRVSGVAVRLGTDVQDVAAVAESLAGELRDAYLARVFTPAEVIDCGVTTDAATAAECLAARFAVKEAVLKVLRPEAGAARPPWTDIEVRRAASGAPSLRLLRAAAELARQARLTGWTCSFSHDGGLAVATVAALAPADPHTTEDPDGRFGHAHR